MFQAWKNPSPALVTKTLVALAFVGLPVLHMNCSPTNAYSAATTDNTPAVITGSTVNPVSATPVPFSVYSATAQVATQITVPIDMVWVIDNSGSMGEEASYVRQNFSAFIATLASTIDIKLALISKKTTTGTGVTLPVSGANYLQINQTVASTNALQILAGAFCSPSATGACNADGIGDYDVANAVRGQLAGFLRPNSRKVFVIVTDDNSTLKSAAFLAAFQQMYPNQTPTVYAFAGFGPTLSPTQARTGVVYSDLARATGGLLYNISDTDWTSSFRTLASNVQQLVSNAVALPAAVISGAIVAVEVDGKLVSPSKYTKSAMGLHLDPSVTAGLTTVSIRITYIP